MVKVMTEDYSGTEQLIIEAARDVFSRKGFYGARMHEISEQAGINKALLHYYFRNKNKLFEKVFEKVVQELADKLFNLEVKSDSIESNLFTFAEHYIDFFQKNQFIPQFVIQEIRENPDWIVHNFNKLNITETKFFTSLFSSLAKSNLSVPNFYEPMLNLISLLLFPIIARPIIQTVMKISDSEFDAIIESRKKSVPQLILNSLKVPEYKNEK